jgi:DNA-binding MarR family transcriptional regulator
VASPDPSTPTLLRTAYNAVSAAIYRAVSETGATDLRPAHGNAMEMLSIQDGLRLTDIAAGAGMAPQSMGEIVDDLVSKGYLARREDPSDRRAKRIYLTQKGRESAEASRIALRAAERRISDTLGTGKYQEMRRNLAAISDLFGDADLCEAHLVGHGVDRGGELLVHASAEVTGVVGDDQAAGWPYLVQLPRRVKRAGDVVPAMNQRGGDVRDPGHAGVRRCGSVRPIVAGAVSPPPPGERAMVTLPPPACPGAGHRGDGDPQTCGTSG